jgi:hypothetical protein
MKAKCVRVIRTETTRGTGTVGSPIRTVIGWYTLDGQLICEQDVYQVSK